MRSRSFSSTSRKASGMQPVSSWLPERPNQVNSVSCPITGGMLPVSRLSVRRSSVTLPCASVVTPRHSSRGLSESHPSLFPHSSPFEAS